MRVAIKRLPRAVREEKNGKYKMNTFESIDEQPTEFGKVVGYRKKSGRYEVLVDNKGLELIKAKYLERVE